MKQFPKERRRKIEGGGKICTGTWRVRVSRQTSRGLRSQPEPAHPPHTPKLPTLTRFRPRQCPHTPTRRSTLITIIIIPLELNFVYFYGNGILIVGLGRFVKWGVSYFTEHGTFKSFWGLGLGFGHFLPHVKNPNKSFFIVSFFLAYLSHFFLCGVLFI